MNDSILAAYLTQLHDSGKSPATISQVVAAVKWQGKNLEINRVNSEGDRMSDVGSVLTLRTSKTDQEGEGTALYIGEPTRRVIRRYCRRAGIESGALFRRIRRGGHITDGRLTVRGARNAIKRWTTE